MFDVVQNPEEFLRTFERIEAIARARKIPRLDFNEQTQEVSADAILAMLAFATRIARKYGTRVYLKLPEDQALATAFEISGLRSYLEGTPPSPDDRGMIRRRQSRKVEAKTAQDLIVFATNTLFGERRREYGSYSTLVECMGNTFEHSVKQAEGQELWWSSIHCNTQSGKAQCTFIDTGIGIFESIKFKGLVRQLAGVVRRRFAKPEVLRDLLDRKIGSRTGETYRNRGMPKIYKDAKSGAIRNLVIITDTVYADIDKNEFRTLRRPFRGTFYYWEFAS